MDVVIWMGVGWSAAGNASRGTRQRHITRCPRAVAARTLRMVGVKEVVVLSPLRYIATPYVPRARTAEARLDPAPLQSDHLRLVRLDLGEALVRVVDLV